MDTSSVDWMLLIYTVPREPSAARVYVWRKLKRLGAIMLQDAAWVLPATPQTREQFQWLHMEINELGGSATLWQSRLANEAQQEKLVRRFEAQLEKPYRKILLSLKRKTPDLAALSRQYQQVHAQDYFKSDLGKKVRAALIQARGDTL